MYETRTSPRARRLPRSGYDVDGDPARLSGDHLDLASVDTGADREVEAGHRVADRHRAPDGPRGPVEHGEEPVPRCVDLMTAEPS